MEIKLPNLWGQGALFGFSGLEGYCDIEESMVGTLLADDIGFKFRNLKSNKDDARLIIKPNGAFNVLYDCVLSDTICAKVYMDLNEDTFTRLNVVMINQTTCYVRANADMDIDLYFFGDVRKEQKEGVTLYDFKGNRFATARKVCGNEQIFVVSYYKDLEENAINGLSFDVDELIKRRIEFYEKLPRPKFKDEAEEKLYYKCFSILRSTVYSPQGISPYKSVTPDRYPHRDVWLWDTSFIAPGIKYIDFEVAKQNLRQVLLFQNEEGFLHFRCSPKTLNANTPFTQPPVLAWGVLELYKYKEDKAFLEENYEKLCSYIDWDMKNRDLDGNGLLEWVEEEFKHCRCGECGMDNTPRYDDATGMDAIDFCSFIANDMRCVSEIAKILGKDEDSKKWQERYEQMCANVNAVLWDEKDKFYYDRKISDGKLHKIKSVASFLPLFAGVCDKEKAEALVKHLFNPNEFGTPFPIPTISVDDKTYVTKDMFRGPVWLNFNYLIAQGLERYGYLKEANEIRQKTIDEIKYWFINEGIVYEFYDSTQEVSPSRLSRKGLPIQPYLPEYKVQSVRDFSWGVTAVIEFLNKR